MSYYHTVVLSFSSGEWDKETILPPKSFKLLKQINKWLAKRHLDPLCNMGKKCGLCSNAVIFGGSYDGIFLDEFCDVVSSIKWRSIENVQLLHWGDESDKFTVIKFPLG